MTGWELPSTITSHWAARAKQGNINTQGYTDLGQKGFGDGLKIKKIRHIL